MADASPAEPIKLQRKIRTCRCGYAKGHQLIVEEPEYTLWGWIMISLLGITPKPDHIAYRCQMCRVTVGTTRDPAALAGRQSQLSNAPKDGSGKPTNDEHP